jgi:phage FluMu protein Com
MQTVNFRCGHCNNVMAVGQEFLGQQVRCPHCQNVVLAPNTAPAPAPTPAPVPTPAPAPAPPEDMFPSLRENEDIFSSSAPTTDSLFDEPSHPLVELPDSPIVTPEHPPEPVPTPALFLEPTLTHHPAPHEEAAPSSSYAGGTEMFQPSPASALTESISAPWMASPSDNGPAAPAEGPSFAEPKKAREPRPVKVNWFIPLVFIPLLLYAVLATVAVAFLYLRMASAPPTMFDQMPDVQGDTPGTQPAKGQSKVFNIDPKMATRPLPKHLEVALGSTIVVGDLEVTPTRLERGHFRTFSEGSEEPVATTYEALKLHLRLKNLAKDYSFTPLDNYFDRKWSPGGGATPLTLLQAGSTTFFGGPANWFPLVRDRNKGTRREWIEGRKNIDREGLAPGATLETFVCTDGWSPDVQRVLFGLDEEGNRKQTPYSGSLLWRVQLRRGLITYKGRMLPATSVIGVEFSSADLPRAAARAES